jgi:hypothetical protein
VHDSWTGWDDVAVTTRSPATVPRRRSAVRSPAAAALLGAPLVLGGVAACSDTEDQALAARYEGVRGRELCAQLDESRAEELFVAAGAATIDERTGETLVGGFSVAEGRADGLPQCTFTAGRSVAGARVYRADIEPGTAADGSTTSRTELAGEEALEQVDGTGTRCVDFLPLADGLWFAVDATLPGGGDACALTRSLAEELWGDVQDLGAPSPG